jgi:hypothetical protein
VRLFHHRLGSVRLLAFLAALVVGFSGHAYAEGEDVVVQPGQPQPAAAAAEDALPEGAIVGRVREDLVRLRVGPRVDNAPITELDRGTVLLIVERAGEWLGVRVPQGFPLVCSAEYSEPADRDHVRVTARRLNLRVHPPEEGKPMPGVFRERVLRGTMLPLLRTDEGWHWVVAPEWVRAYVKAEFVEELGDPAEHAALLAGAREKRAEMQRAVVASRQRILVQKAGLALRETLGKSQDALYRLRAEGGFDRAPLIALADEIDRGLQAERLAPERVRKLVAALRSDVEAEIEIRLARKDAELARIRNLGGAAVPPLTPTLANVTLRGVIRWEAAPKWQNGGAFILWIDEQPRYVLRLTTGGPLPYPDLEGNADGKVHAVTGRQPGERVFGLPAIDVMGIDR